jgi:hypothetical protein
MKKQNEKQQSQINAVRQVNQRLRQDMEYLKKGKRPPARPKFDLNSSAFMDLSNSSFRQSLCPSEISASPFLVDVKESDCQTDLDAVTIAWKDQEILQLQEKLRLGQLRIDELELKQQQIPIKSQAAANSKAQD